MKRHQSLVPLSREHHDGLLLAMRLQQGRKALLRLWSHDVHWQAKYVVKFFDEHLAAHFQTEEESIFPIARTEIPDTRDCIKELLEEHSEMRSLVEYLRHPDDKKLECSLTQFGEILEHHIRTEERILFPLCEQSLSEESLEKIGKLIQDDHRGTAQ